MLGRRSQKTIHKILLTSASVGQFRQKKMKKSYFCASTFNISASFQEHREQGVRYESEALMEISKLTKDNDINVYKWVCMVLKEKKELFCN